MTVRRSRSSSVLHIAVALGIACGFLGANRAAAQQAPVGLGTAASFAVLAGTTVTNTGPSVISGDVGVSPGAAVVGFPPGLVNNGTIHAADAVAAQAQADVTTAYNDAAGRSTTATVTADLAGQTLVSGVYTGATLGLTGTVTLDAQGNPNAVFIFQAASTLITASSSVVALTNGADACNVYWQVGSSATLGTNSTFVGTVLALTSVTATTSATINGRLLARNGEVTLDSNVITNSACGTTTTNHHYASANHDHASANGHVNTDGCPDDRRGCHTGDGNVNVATDLARLRACSRWRHLHGGAAPQPRLIRDSIESKSGVDGSNPFSSGSHTVSSQAWRHLPGVASRPRRSWARRLIVAQSTYTRQICRSARSRARAEQSAELSLHG